MITLRGSITRGQWVEVLNGGASLVVDSENASKSFRLHLSNTAIADPTDITIPGFLCRNGPHDNAWSQGGLSGFAYIRGEAGDVDVIIGRDA